MFTDKLFTGQREMAGLGIYHYNARFYSPKLGRFLSADTIVPKPFNAQNLNRYSYVLNNPLRFTDPTGHNVDCGIGDSYCTDAWQKYYRSNWKKVISGRPSFKSFMKMKDTYEYYQRHPDQAVEDTKGPNGTYQEKESIEQARTYSEYVLHKWFEPISYDAGIKEIDKFVASGKPATQWIMTVIFATGVYAWMSQDEGGGSGGPIVVQTGEHTLNKRTLEALGLSREEGKSAMEALKKDNGLSPNLHATKIWSNGDVYDADTGKFFGNLFDYLP